MMRVPRNSAPRAVGFNMTPLIDVVFLLIIFFLVSSNLARRETQLQLDLPDATTGQRPEEDDQKRRIVVNVPAEGRILIGSQTVEMARFESLLRYERGHAARPLEIRIRTNRSVPYRAIEPIMVACARAGVWNVSFSVLNQP